jgi:hypothetical protein
LAEAERYMFQTTDTTLANSTRIWEGTTVKLMAFANGHSFQLACVCVGVCCGPCLGGCAGVAGRWRGRGRRGSGCSTDQQHGPELPRDLGDDAVGRLAARSQGRQREKGGRGEDG